MAGSKQRWGVYGNSLQLLTGWPTLQNRGWTGQTDRQTDGRIFLFLVNLEADGKGLTDWLNGEKRYAQIGINELFFGWRRFLSFYWNETKSSFILFLSADRETSKDREEKKYQIHSDLLHYSNSQPIAPKGLLFLIWSRNFFFIELRLLVSSLTGSISFIWGWICVNVIRLFSLSFYLVLDLIPSARAPLGINRARQCDKYSGRFSGK